jgi:hypothetical protein
VVGIIGCFACLVCPLGTQAIEYCYAVGCAYYQSLQDQDVFTSWNGKEDAEGDNHRGNTANHGSKKLKACDAKLLFFSGMYIGGAGRLQGANSVPIIRNRAFSPSDVSESYIVNAPYTHDYQAELEEMDREQHRSSCTCSTTSTTSSGSGSGNDGGGGGDSCDDDSSGGGGGASTNCGCSCSFSSRIPRHLLPLTAAEIASLDELEQRVVALEFDGVPIAGVVVEFVRASDGRGLRAAFLARLRAWLTARRMLLIEDSVMMGLRCGRAFMSL